MQIASPRQFWLAICFLRRKVWQQQTLRGFVMPGMALMRRWLSRRTRLDLHWIKTGGWLGSTLSPTIRRTKHKRRIESIALATNDLGSQRLADAYGVLGATRRPDDVRSSAQCGDLFAYLVMECRPEIVVEFGSAFGVSGMYFVSGLESVAAGHLFSFEINPEWAAIAERNIGALSNRFTLTRGSFEDHVDAVVPGPIGIALVDGIHTYEFVMRQFDLLLPRMVPGGIIIFDDIDFGNPGARMHEAWTLIASHRSVVAAVEIHRHAGVIELASGRPRTADYPAGQAPG